MPSQCLARLRSPGRDGHPVEVTVYAAVPCDGAFLSSIVTTAGTFITKQSDFLAIQTIGRNQSSYGYF